MALNLFKSTIPFLGVDLCRQFVLPEFISHAEHINPNIRSSVTANIPVLMSVFSEEKKKEEELDSIFYNEDDEDPIFALLECFVRLSKDPHHLVRTFTATSRLAAHRWAICGTTA